MSESSDLHFEIGPVIYPNGEQEGEVCGRVDGIGERCAGVLELRHRDDGGCSCHISPPCSYCMSLVPECPTCGWRAEEP